MTELKPCWICQSPAELDYHCGTRYVECTNEDCGNQGPLDWNDEGAISAWNREAETNLIPRPAGEVGELVERLRYTYEHGIFVAAENGMLAGADEAADRITALSAEVAVAQDYKDCGCSYDHPDDICLGHMKLFERRNAALSAEVERLRAWQNAALEVEPNIDLDIERLGAKP